ncbi:MAG: V-type ATP synthase subunit D [Oscillospiraceae bacterium]|nr:V-type ATP synthase subunit D [Oscillospiraceae bacterium]
MPNRTPTKGNLLALKRSLTLARLGYDLMDRKRNILIREIMGLLDRAAEIQGRIESTFADAYTALRSANITLGQHMDLAETVTLDDSVGIRFRSVMGVEIPIVSAVEEQENTVPYGFALTNSRLDEARGGFVRVKRLTRELAEVETSIYRLAVAIKKTQKRANALQNIIIPDFTRGVKFISEALEEKDREDFSRLKLLKSRKPV